MELENNVILFLQGGEYKIQYLQGKEYICFLASSVLQLCIYL